MPITHLAYEKEKKSSKSLMSLLTNTGRLFNDNERR